jgi:hypothetical protein
MRYQKSLDPVQMASTFAHQSLPLAMEAPRILFLGRWRPNHATTLRIALHEAYNCPEQTFGVDIVCLDMLGATIDRKTRCIEDVVLDAVGDEHPMQPEPVVACLIAAYRPHPADVLVSKLRLQAADKLKQTLRVPPGIACTLILSPSRGANVATSQVERLNSMARKSVFLKSSGSTFAAVKSV